MIAASSPPRLITLILLTAYTTLTLNMFLPSLVNIAADLQASYAVVSLAVAGYLAATAVVQLVVGPLSDRVGRRPVMLVCVALFAIASLMCALAQSVWAFLAFRMLQSGIIAGYALSLAVVRDTRAEAQAASLIGYITMTMALAPMIGPMIGGMLDGTLGWRAIFLFYAISGLGLLVLCWVDLGETRRAPSGPEAASETRPTVLLAAPGFWAFALCATFATGTFYVYLAGAPLVAQVQFGLSPAVLGILLGTTTAGFMAGGYLSGRFAARVPLPLLMIVGQSIACLGVLAGLGLALTGQISPFLFFSSTVFVGLGNGLTLPSSTAGAMSVYPEHSGAAAGWTGALIAAVGASLTLIAGSLLPEAAPAATLLSLMLVCSGSALAAGLIAAVLRRRG